MLSVEIEERNFCSHCRSVRESSPEKPARPSSASCCAKSVHATKIRAVSVTKLRRIAQNLTKHPRPNCRDYTRPHCNIRTAALGPELLTRLSSRGRRGDRGICFCPLPFPALVDAAPWLALACEGVLKAWDPESIPQLLQLLR